jgi:hypothetical protein
VLTGSLLFSDFRPCVLFLARAPASSRSVFPSPARDFLGSGCDLCSGCAGDFVFPPAQCFGRSALLVRRRLLRFGLRSFGVRDQASLFFLGGRWRLLSARPLSCSSVVRFLPLEAFDFPLPFLAPSIYRPCLPVALAIFLLFCQLRSWPST